MTARDSYSIKSDKQRGTAPGFVKVAIFVFFWACFGFAIGTVTLLYPVRWWTTFCRTRGFSEGFESGGVVTLILILVAISMSCALWASTNWVRTRSFTVKLVMPVLVAGLAYYAYSFWINPESMQANMSEDVQASRQFTFGPFPDQSKLEQLKAEGYTAVISLLHPAVVPFEPQLIRREEEEAKAAGIELIHLPMLPWVSSNTESIEKLRELAEKKEGRYYIHCYLGTDRVNVARRIIEGETGEGAVAATGKARRFEDVRRFERGEIYELEKDFYLLPYPTDEEFLGYMLGGQVKNVVALLDSTNKSEKKRLDHEVELARLYALNFHHVDVGPDNYDPAKVVEAVNLARSLDRPVAIHAFFTYPKYNSPMAEAIVQAALTGKRPLPPSMFSKPLRGGPVEIVAPNVAVGPRPADHEWAEVLAARGVKVVIYAGSSDSGEESAEQLAVEAGLNWIHEGDPAEILASLTSGQGPFFVYGPQSVEIGAEAAARLGPALPVAKRAGS